jgi:hypothetical protein
MNHFDVTLSHISHADSAFVSNFGEDFLKERVGHVAVDQWGFSSTAERTSRVRTHRPSSTP